MPEELTRVDRWITSAKNHPFLSILIFGAILLTGAASLAESFSKLKIFIGPFKAEDVDPCKDVDPQDMEFDLLIECEAKAQKEENL